MFNERKVIDDNYGQFIILDENIEKNVQRNEFIRNLDYMNESQYNIDFDCINDSYYDDIEYCNKDNDMSIIKTLFANIYCIWTIFTTIIKRR